jgi:hypothetical protein
MRKYIIVLSISLITINLKGQLFSPDPEGLDYFHRGSELINLGDFKGADSLLTLALCSFKNQNVYYNRAVSRLLQTDTLGYCLDISIAANKYFDKQAENLFNNICCIKVDTIYYNKKRIKSDKSNYRYFEIIKYPKYDSVINGSFHDIKSNKPVVSFDFGCNDNMLGFNSSTTDMIAGYIIEDSTKYYYKSTKRISIFNTLAYEDLKRRAKILLSTKYSNIKTDNENENLKVFFKVYFDNAGNVLKVHYEGFYPEITYEGNIKELELDLLDIADNYPKVTPAKFFNDKIWFVAYDYIEF